MNIYVGNLAYSVSGDDLRASFEAFGEVSSANVINDRETGRSKGFGFVEMPSAEAAKSAIDELNGQEIQGRAVRVNEAQPRTGGGGGRGRGGDRPQRRSY